MNPSEWPAPGAPADPPVPPAAVSPAPPPPAPPSTVAASAPGPLAPPPPPPPGAMSPLALGRPGATAFTPGASAPPATATAGGSMGAAVVYGLVAGVAGGLAWYLAVILTKRQFVYLAVGVGLLVGTAVAKGARRWTGSTPLVAAVITLATMCVAQYFVDRWAAIQYLKEVGSPARIPLFLSLPRAVDVVRAGMDAEPSQLLFWAIAVVLSFITARKYRP